MKRRNKYKRDIITICLIPIILTLVAIVGVAVGEGGNDTVPASKSATAPRETSPPTATIDVSPERMSITEPTNSPTTTAPEPTTTEPVTEPATTASEPPAVGLLPDKPKMPPPRFVLRDDGTYHNPDADPTNRAVLMFTGDLMASYKHDSAAGRGRFDWSACYDYVGDVLFRSDFAMANLETMVSQSSPYIRAKTSIESPLGQLPYCNASPDFLKGVASVFDAVATANNHNLDTGILGINETVDNLDDYNILSNGLFKSGGGDRFLSVDVNGIKVAFISYVSGSINGFAGLYSDEELEQINRYKRSTAARDIKAARNKGAEFVIVYMHWGTQNSQVISSSQLGAAQELADIGADYILGAHPHVLQEYRVLTATDGRKVPCYYSLGNFLSGMDMTPNNTNRDAVIACLELERDSDGTVRIVSEGYVPCYILLNYSGEQCVVKPMGEAYQNEAARSRIRGALGNKVAEIF
ncbi:MAG: CapA family protein [Oscillospiraceae bacterium]|nr:CapA family protein [Oscillospiraceae bacterium]